MRKARPPAELVEYHRAALATADAMVAALEDGDMEAFENVEDPGEGTLSPAARGPSQRQSPQTWRLARMASNRSSWGRALGLTLQDVALQAPRCSSKPGSIGGVDGKCRGAGEGFLCGRGRIPWLSPVGTRVQRLASESRTRTDCTSVCGLVSVALCSLERNETALASALIRRASAFLIIER